VSQGFASVVVPVTGLSAGTQLGTSGNFVFANSNGVTFGMSGSSQITASVTVPGPSMGISNFANSAGTSGTVSGSLFLAGGNNITLSQSVNGQAATVTVVGRSVTADYFENIPTIAASASGAMGGFAFSGSHRSLFVAPLGNLEELFPADITAGTMFWNLSQSGSTATMSAAFTSQFFWGIYTANSNTLSLLNSGSVSFGFGAASTNNSTGFVGQRFLSAHSSLWSSSPAFAYGSRYWFAYFWSSSGVLNQSVSLLGGYKYSTVQRNATVGNSATGTSQGWAKWYGIYSATTNAVPVSINSNELNKVQANAGFVPHIVMVNNTASSIF
jgi:hypothetical protein